ncbi:MAG: tetratricopeptide repeat protein, partial [Bacteroidota bacterium]
MMICCALCSLPAFSANRNIDSLLAVIDTATGINKAEACLKACNYYYRNNNDEALRHARTALEISEKIKYREGVKRAWYELGVAYDHRGVFDTALVFLNLAMEYGMQDKDSLFIAQVHINKGNIFYYQGNYDSTLFCYIEASRLFEVLGNRRGEANSYLGQGNVFYQQGMYDKAVKYFKDALKIYHELKDEVLISYALNNIGTAYYVQGDLQTATGYFIKSIEIKRKLRDQFGEAYTLNNLGDIYFEQSLYSLALDY